MCGIAGYSFHPDSGLDRTLAAQSLLAAIAERGSDAVGYAYRSGGGPVVVHKQRTGASQLLEAVAIPADATQGLFHVRDYTKGHPSLAANNHPIRHGAVIGIHNGVIRNDEELLSDHRIARAEPGMSVDSEAIFALVEEAAHVPSALEELYGSMATAWLDERVPHAVSLARGIGRPLWLGHASGSVLFASTVDALELVERYVDVRLEKHEVPEGTLLTLEDGQVTGTTSFAPDRSFSEEPLPAVRAPEERRSCLERLALVAARRAAFAPARAR